MKEHVQGRVSWAGPRLQGVEGEGSREARTQERIDTISLGQLKLVRSGSQEDQGFEVGEAGGTGEFRRLDSELPGSALRCVERELIVVGGIRQLRESVGVDETDGNKIQGATSCRLVDNHKGANVAPRGVRDSCEGELWRENLERSWHETRPQNSGLLGNR